MEGNRNCFPSPTKGNNMAAPSEALLRLFPFRFLEHTELKSWVLEVHDILAQTVVFSSSPWFEPGTSSRLGRPFRVVAGVGLSLLPSPPPWRRPPLAPWLRLIPVAWLPGCLGALWAATEARAKYLCTQQAPVSPVLLLPNVYLLQLPCSPQWLLMGVTGTML